MPSDRTPKVDYAIIPKGIEDGIQRFLDPVIEGLRQSRDSFGAAHDEMKAAHDASTPGWFGGEGNGEVRPACSSFLNEAVWQLQQLNKDQAGLVASLEEYKAKLQGHVAWIKTTEEKITNRFRAIHDELDRGGR